MTTANTPSRAKLADKTCTIKRVTIDRNTGKTNTLTAVSGLSSLPCTMLMPLGAHMMERMKAREFGANVNLSIVYVFGDYAIREGDYMTIDSVDYPVREVMDWDHGYGFLECIVEVIKAAETADAEYVR